MADKPAAFSKPFAKRIINAVDAVEHFAQDRTGGRRGQPGATEEWFWAALLGLSSDGLRYSWYRVRPDGRGGWQGYDPAVLGEHNAIEVNGHRGIDFGTVVKLHLTDFDQDGKPLYSFEYQAPVQGRLPIHDHRDNAHGGMAFACYHPGTAIPQQPYSI